MYSQKVPKGRGEEVASSINRVMPEGYVRRSGGSQLGEQTGEAEDPVPAAPGRCPPAVQEAVRAPPGPAPPPPPLQLPRAPPPPATPPRPTRGTPLTFLNH
ncbi:unnamed protein product [Nezara viridula]|uniref:Uncharacterized protein n=1 Tax=Nezara viridula TaxID=85310 RepID=A0A9P0E7Q8_NEZVI|nr:unnamed protein product [Nezara viridula]